MAELRLRDNDGSRAAKAMCNGRVTGVERICNRSATELERKHKGAPRDRLSTSSGALPYGAELNEWAATTRERLWLEYFTDEALLNRLSGC